MCFRAHSPVRVTPCQCFHANASVRVPPCLCANASVQVPSCQCLRDSASVPGVPTLAKRSLANMFYYVWPNQVWPVPTLPKNQVCPAPSLAKPSLAIWPDFTFKVGSTGASSYFSYFGQFLLWPILLWPVPTLFGQVSVWPGRSPAPKTPHGPSLLRAHPSSRTPPLREDPGPGGAVTPPPQSGEGGPGLSRGFIFLGLGHHPSGAPILQGPPPLGALFFGANWFLVLGNEHTEETLLLFCPRFFFCVQFVLFFLKKKLVPSVVCSILSRFRFFFVPLCVI